MLLRGLENISNYEDYANLKTDELNSVQNSFSFGSRKCGFIKRVEIKRNTIRKVNGKYLKTISIHRNWEIGCNVLPSQITELYNRKQDCKAEYFNYSKNIVEVVNGEVKTVKVLKEKRNFGENIEI